MAYYVQEDMSVTIRNALRALLKRPGVRAVFLFGSQAEGTAGPDSDVDLGVFVDGAESWDVFQRVEFAVGIQREAGDRIEPHVFPAKALEKPEPASFAEFVIEHGRRIHPAL
jgi:predicted nucleotidyltransferase